MEPLTPSPELAAHIQRWIDELQPDPLRGWPVRVCKEELNALPLHSTLIYLWAIRPDGAVLCMDHEAFGHPTEPETNPLVRYAVILQGARAYPELQALAPARPAGAQPCDDCQGTGALAQGEAAPTPCFRCRGLGWLVSLSPSPGD